MQLSHELAARGHIALHIFAGGRQTPREELTRQSPSLLAIPAVNLAARIANEEGTSLTVAPSDTSCFLAAARQLIGDAELGSAMGAKARGYAEKNFTI